VPRGPKPGTDGARKKDRPKTGRLTEGRPKPPAELAGEARAEWERVTAELESAGLLCRVDRAALVELCRSWADLVECRRVLAAEGRVLKTPIQTSKGDKIGERVTRHPMVIVLNDAFKRWSALAKEYGLTALSRLRMQVETGEEDPAEEDELMRILRGDEAAA